MSKEENDGVETVSPPAKTLDEHAADLADAKRKFSKLDQEAKQAYSDMKEMKDVVLATELSTKNVKSMLELPPNLYYKQPDGSTLEIRAKDDDAPIETYDEKTAKTIAGYEESIAAMQKEIEIAKISGTKTVEHHYTRSWSVWLHEPKPDKAKVERAIRGESRKKKAK